MVYYKGAREAPRIWTKKRERGREKARSSHRQYLRFLAPYLERIIAPPKTRGEPRPRFKSCNGRFVSLPPFVLPLGLHLFLFLPLMTRHEEGVGGREGKGKREERGRGEGGGQTRNAIVICTTNLNLNFRQFCVVTFWCHFQPTFPPFFRCEEK